MQRILIISGFVFIMVLLFNACDDKIVDGKIDIRDFYYPIESLKEPLVYEYEPKGNVSTGPQYYYFRTVETDTAVYLTSNIYNQAFEVEQFSIEEIVSNGTIQKDYFLYTMDSLGRQNRFEAEIEYPNAFPFEVKDSSGVFLQKMKWVFNEEPLQSTTLIRNRRYMGDTSFNYKGKMYKAVKFSVAEILDDYFDGHLETKTKGEEIYAENLGLVYFKKQIGDGLTLEYELVETYGMDKLEEKAKQQIQ